MLTAIQVGLRFERFLLNYFGHFRARLKYAIIFYPKKICL